MIQPDSDGMRKVAGMVSDAKTIFVMGRRYGKSVYFHAELLRRRYGQIMCELSAADKTDKTKPPFEIKNIILAQEVEKAISAVFMPLC
jgi:hypothetical protein